jgi:hypothetical protein
LSSVDTGTDVITLTAAHGYSIGDEVIFICNDEDAYGPDVFCTRSYFVLTTPTSSTLTISAIPGGATLDWANNPGTGLTMMRRNRQVACWKFQGFEVTITNGDEASQRLISTNNLGAADGAVAHHDALPSHLIFEHLYIEGGTGVFDGPRDGMVLDGRYIAVRDSLIQGLKDNNDETHGIALSRALGPIWIENTGIAAVGINVLVAAD